LTKEAIERDELVLFVSPQHPWAERESVTKDELMEEPFITREMGSGTRDVIEESLAKEGVTKLNVAMELGNSSAIKTAVQAGLGVSILSRRAIQPQLESGIIKQVRIKDVVLDRDFYLITVSERYASPASSKFMDMLRDADASRLLPALA
jgi:DNA-binding transcriptional LysR family regulator